MSRPALRRFRGLVIAVTALVLAAALVPPAAAATEVVFHVDGSHPGASDSHPGTAEEPVATIGGAVELAAQANAEGRPVVVRIAPGVYREAVEIGNPGSTKPASLTIEASEGVVLSGAQPITGWTRSDGNWTAPWPHRWGMSDIPSGWGHRFTGDKAAYRELLLRSETVFDDDTPLRAVASRSDLEPGTFHVDEGAGLLYVRLAGDREPTHIEAAIHQRVLRIRDRADVTVRGLTIERGRGALQTTGVELVNTDRVTLEDITVRQHAYNGVGTVRTRDTVVRRAALIDNGVKGLAGYRDVDLLVEDILLEGNNWRGYWHEHTGWDVVHKWMGTRNATARRVISRNNLGRGFWLDTDNQNTTVEELISVANAGDGLFLERNPGPITVRNSVFCGNEGPGVLDGRSNNVTLIDSRLFGNVASYQLRFSGQQRTEEIRDWQTGDTVPVDSRNWRFERNTVVGNGSWLLSLNNPDSTPVVRATLTSDDNRWYHPEPDNPFWISGDDGGAYTLDEFRAWLGRGNEQSSTWEPWSGECPFTGDIVYEPTDSDEDSQDEAGPEPTRRGRFLDVPPDHVHADSIERVAEAGITAGCAIDMFCPSSSGTRAQMATFLARARQMDVSGLSTVDFTDVSPTSVHRPAILAVATAQIARGCAPERYCPSAPVTRAQMATFLAKSLALEPQATSAFRDVAVDSAHAGTIAAVSEAGIALGCGDGRFCPNEPVTRGQVATFLARALDAGL